MRSIVSRLLITVALPGVCLLCSTVIAETAQCVDPPGGAVTCESGQVASCAVKGGKVDGRCKTPPASKRGNELKAFVLSDLTGKAVSADDLNKAEYREALRKGHLQTGDGGVVTFSIPKELSKVPEPKD